MDVEERTPEPVMAKMPSARVVERRVAVVRRRVVGKCIFEVGGGGGWKMVVGGELNFG